LSVTWSKINFMDNDLFDKCSLVLKDLISEASEDSIDEICKIFWAFNNLNYNHNDLVKGLHQFLESNIEKVDLIDTFDLFISFSNMYPDNIETTTLLISVYTI
jgi:hypothetical protein